MVRIILPNQLFGEKIDEESYLLEHPKYFTNFDFHKQKLMLHRASMKSYSEENSIDNYIEFDQDLEKPFKENDEVEVYRPEDREIRNWLQKMAGKHDVKLEIQESPMFVTSMDWNRDYFSDNRFFQLDYYKKQRKRLDILVDEEGKPEGGKWSFDPENREKMPEDEEPPEIPQFDSHHIEEAQDYVEENFPDNPGKTENFFWPVTREQAVENLNDFLENRLEKFGKYQDAFDSDLKFGYHSLLSSSLNIGLITPEEVVEKTLEKHEEKDYPMNSLEGFVRQIIGWREYLRAVYHLKPEMPDRDYWNNEDQIPEEFYTGETGITPVDDSVMNAVNNAYCHHIERLMVLGNMMLLLEIDPDEVYRWFMEMFIDSYEWVMVPNIYGMSQYSDPEIMTKPYISSSNYIKKMSHYSGDWEETWDGLYWNFISEHKEKVSEINRMGFMTSTLERMNEETVEEHKENAEAFRQDLDM
ncbi:MAG: cryptochrome/photolyase family protein [Nanohaloarchaea archaeon SW_7_43_1]|nr:MAG: cryptochrome/photolyase family protein [Nanohaloarchaea archaeon SW_7_43_1]